MGTWKCWLFGHKFVSVKITGENKDYYSVLYTPSPFCTRCGITKEELKENEKTT